MTSHHRKGPWKRRLTGSHPEMAIGGHKLGFFHAFMILHGSNLHEMAIKWQKMMSRDLK